MSHDDVPPDDIDGIQRDAHAWLEDLAEAEGLTTDEAIQLLISAYWRLAEIGLLVDSEIEEHAQSDDRSAESESEREVIQNRISHLATDDDLASPIGTLTSVTERLDSLGERLDRLESTIDELPDAASIHEIDHLEARATELSEQYERLDTEIGEVNGQLARIHDTSVDQETFEEFVRSATAAHESLSTEQDALRERITTEFGYLRVIIEHLLETTGDVSAQADQFDPDVFDHLRAHVTEERQLATLKRSANRQDVSNARCGHCDEPVDLSLLEDPSCPRCEYTFTELRSTPTLFGLRQSHTLAVSTDTSRGTEQPNG